MKHDKPQNYYEARENLGESWSELLKTIDEELRKTALFKSSIKIVEKFRRCRNEQR